MNAFCEFGSVVSFNQVRDYTYMMLAQLLIKTEK